MLNEQKAHGDIANVLEEKEKTWSLLCINLRLSSTYLPLNIIAPKSLTNITYRTLTSYVIINQEI